MPTLPQGAAVPFDPDGNSVVARAPIAQATAGGALVAAGATDTALTAAAAATDRHYIQRIIMQCTVVATADGLISIKDNAAGTIIFNVQVEQPVMAAGTVLQFTFETPLPSATAGTISVDTAANTGTWRYFIVGYDMAVSVVT